MHPRTTMPALLIGLLCVASAHGAVRLFFTPINGPCQLTDPLLNFECTNPAGPDCHPFNPGARPYQLTCFPDPDLDPSPAPIPVPTNTCAAYLWLRFDSTEPVGAVIDQLNFRLVYEDCTVNDQCALYQMSYFGMQRWNESCPIGCPEVSLTALNGITNSGVSDPCNLYDGASRTVLLGAFSTCSSGGGQVWLEVFGSGITYAGGFAPPDIWFGDDPSFVCVNSSGFATPCRSIVPVWNAFCGDCNCNGTFDVIELQNNPFLDCNNNNVIDACDVGCGGTETDCNGNGRPDWCDMYVFPYESTDCNGNLTPDECDVAILDCNNNQIVDECEIEGICILDPAQCYPDCDNNQVPDSCELAGHDCDCDGVPDKCEDDWTADGIPYDCEVDCNTNGQYDFRDITFCPPGELWCRDCDHNCRPDGCDLADCPPGDPHCADCNTNGVPDVCDITAGTGGDCDCDGIPDDCELDLDTNGVPDDCQGVDCNANGVDDYLEIAAGRADCNFNCIIDDCELDPTDPDGDGVIADDCNGNYVIDQCEIFHLTEADTGPYFCTHDCASDCNETGLPDVCDIADGASQDCNRNGIPDECDVARCDPGNVLCDDCNGNGLMDECDILLKWSEDCNHDRVPDECQVADLDCNHNNYIDECDIKVTGVSQDCNYNNIPDECDLDPSDPDGNGETSPDCNENGVADECDVKLPYYGGTSPDCQDNGIPDECDLDPADPDGNGETSVDRNLNNIPDECEIKATCCLPDGDCELETEGYCRMNGGNWLGEHTDFCHSWLCVGDLQGTVTDRNTGGPVADAVVTIEGWATTTADAFGRYAFEDVPAGEHRVSATKEAEPPLKPGYYTRTWTPEITGGRLAKRDFSLTPKFDADAPEIVEVTGSFVDPADRVTFLDTVPLPDEFTVTIDWNLHNYVGVPRVRWITPRCEYVDQGTPLQTVYTRTLDLGNDFGPGGVLTVIADAGDGTHSAPIIANFDIAPRPPGMNDASITAGGGQKSLVGDFLSYAAPSISGSDALAFVEGARDAIPSGIHMFGGEAFKLRAGFQIGMTVLNGGTIRTNNLIDSGPTHGLHTNIAGAGSLHVVPAAGLQWSFDRGLYSWIPGGWFTVDADFHVNVPPRPVRFWIGFVPCYFRGYIAAGADLNMAMEFFGADDRPVWLGGSLALDPFPYAEASVGVGHDRVLSIEGFLGGGARMHFLLPPPADEEALTLMQIYLRAGVRLKVLRWTKTWSVDRTWTIHDKHYGEIELLADFGPIPRDFTLRPGGYTVFVANDSGKTLRGACMTVDQPMQENIFEDASPDIITTQNGLIGVWLTDDLTRTISNGTAVQYFIRDDDSGVWSPPAFIADDGTADYHPTITTMANSNALCAWENVKVVLDEPVNPDDPAQVEATIAATQQNMEIAVAHYDAKADTWSPPLALTDNGHFDYAPQTASDGVSDHAMVTWLSDAASTDLLGSNGPPAVQLHYQRFAGASFYGPAGVAAASLPHVINYDLHYQHPLAWVILAGDTDGRIDTPDDRELFAATYDGETWTPIQQLTADAVEDAKPQFARFGDDGLVVVWYRGGDFHWAPVLSLNGATVAVDLEPENSSGAADFKLIASPASGHLAIIWQDASEDVVDLWAAVYDPDTQIWSAPVRWTGDSAGRSGFAMERQFAFTFDNTGKLAGLYDKTQMIYTTGVLQIDGEDIVVDNFPQPAQTDLQLLEHTLHRDLAVHPADVTLAPDRPEIGTPIQVQATVRNLGDLPASAIRVHFYDGDPDTGGVLIEEVYRAGPLPGGDAATFPATWTILDADATRTLHVVVDPLATIPDPDRSNNRAAVSGVLRPDLSVAALHISEPGPTDYVITARIANEAGIPPAAFNVNFVRDSVDGQVLATVPVTAELHAGDSIDVQWRWENPSVFTSEPVKVYIVIDPDGAVNEVDESNNHWFVQLWNRSQDHDCNLNGYADRLDLSAGRSLDLNTNGIPDECENPQQLHIVGPLPNTVAAGTNGHVDAFVQSQFIGMPHRPVRFTRQAGALTFLAGTLSPDGSTATLQTDEAGLARMPFHADAAGLALLDIEVPGTPLTAFAMFHVNDDDATLTGDLNLDGVVNLDDFALMSACLAGPGATVRGDCFACMLDDDMDIDLRDFALFQAAYPASP